MSYKAIHLVARPSGAPTRDLFKVVEKDLPETKPGQILIKQTHMSLDPAMLGWMSDDTESYIPPVALNTVMRSSGYGEIIESKHDGFSVGDKVTGLFGWQELCLSDGQGVNKVDSNLAPEMVLSIFALPGLTATHGLFNIGKPQQGETLLVSGAAGSVGSIVGQLAKAEGLTVIGVAGSDEKCEWLRQGLGFDHTINYKAGDINDKLLAVTPNGIDIYFENTGGAIQHAAFNRMNAHGRIVVCGMISDYVTDTPAPGPNWIPIIKKRLSIQGFTMPDHFHQVKDLLAKLTPYVQAGKIQYRCHAIEGLESAMDGLNLLLSGANKGKLIVKL